MGLKDTFAGAANAVFSAVGDIKETVTYYVHVSTVYNSSSGVTEAQVNAVSIGAIFSRYKKKEVDNAGVKPTDLKMRMLQTDLTGPPTTNDTVRRIENDQYVIYQVIDFDQDAAGATWNLQLRRP